MSERVCPRCGVAFTLDKPATARRLCDACRAKRATFFECLACGEQREAHSADRDADRRPVRCCVCRQEALTIARTAEVVRSVVALEPALGVDVITGAVLTAAPSQVERKWLEEHLAEHPDALTTGAGAPRGVCRLAAKLVESGATAVGRPCCSNCGKPAMILDRVEGGGRQCPACLGERRAEPCCRCGRRLRVCTRDELGGPVCNPCFAKDLNRWEDCAGCAKRRAVNARAADGRAWCVRCYAAPTAACSICGTIGPPAWRRDGEPLCAPCYVRHRRERRPCGGCGRVKIINKRAGADGPDLRNGCNWATVAVCTRCGVETQGFGAANGRHLCIRCIANERVDALLTGTDGVIAGPFEGVRSSLRDANQPRSVITWLYSSPGARLLGQLVNGEVPLDHEAIDGLDQTPSLRHLRQLLVATGALPEQDPHLAALERHVRSVAAGVEVVEDARLLRGYGTWRVLGRLRRRPQPLTFAAVKYARQCFDLSFRTSGEGYGAPDGRPDQLV